MSEIQTHRNDHGVLCCDRTERTDAPICFTRLSFNGVDAIFGSGGMMVLPYRAPMFRGYNQFGMQDGEPLGGGAS